MSQSLSIAITQRLPGWGILLGQLGLADEQVNWGDLDPARYAAVIVSAWPSVAQKQALRSYLDGGGAVLDTGGLLESLEPGSFRRAGLGTFYVSPKEAVFRASRIVDIGSSGRVHRGAEHLGGSIHLASSGNGYVAHLPFDPARLLLTTGSRRRRFHTGTSRMPDEVVASVTKGEIRSIVERSLQWLLERRGLPYLHLWHFPGDCHGIFAFRIDSDYGTARELLALHDVASARNIRQSWFIHVEPQQDLLGMLGGFTGDELGVHAWRHRTWDSYETNAANIAEADAVLRAAGIAPSGYAAPNGRWNYGLADALEERGYEYSSEFALDYDDLPFSPWNRWRISPVLQVPIHPVSIGNFIRVKASEKEMIAYYHEVIELKKAREEPVILYGHPGHGRTDVIDAIFAKANEERLDNMTMGEYARWWRRRSAARFSAEIDDGRLTIRSQWRDDDVHLRLADAQRGSAVVATDGEHSFDTLAWKPRPVSPAAPADLARARGFSPVLLRHTIEDFNSIIRQ